MEEIRAGNKQVMDAWIPFSGHIKRMDVHRATARHMPEKNRLWQEIKN